jgi:precorrin-6A/cobalt-precorrin-6A reductase
MKLLLLGGTSNAIRLCNLLLGNGYKVIYSIKGLVRQPQLNCQIHSGGFGGVQGLIHFIQQHRIDCILDATHPYAVQMSHHAQLAAAYCNLPCLHYQRPAWQQRPTDNWILFDDITQLAPLLVANDNKGSRFFFSIGQLSATWIAQKSLQHTYIVRSVLGARFTLPDKVIWIKNRGPFILKEERKLFNHYKINALVSKNSGGTSVAAKIQIAQEMQLPVYMLRRPHFESRYSIFDSVDILIRNISAII